MVEETTQLVQEPKPLLPDHIPHQGMIIRQDLTVQVRMGDLVAPAVLAEAAQEAAEDHLVAVVEEAEANYLLRSQIKAVN